MIAATGLAALLLAQAVPAANASSGAPSSTSAAAAPMPTGAEMTARIEANDAALFWNFFEACDPAAAAPLLHEDFRMLHDLAGLAAASAEEFLAGEREQCDRRKSGGEDEGYRNRRLLVPGSRTIKQLGGHDHISITAYIKDRSVLDEMKSSKVLVLTATKDDVDLVAMKKISPESFKGRVHIVEY